MRLTVLFNLNMRQVPSDSLSFIHLYMTLFVTIIKYYPITTYMEGTQYKDYVSSQTIQNVRMLQ